MAAFLRLLFNVSAAVFDDLDRLVEFGACHGALVYLSRLVQLILYLHPACIPIVLGGLLSMQLLLARYARLLPIHVLHG